MKKAAILFCSLMLITFQSVVADATTTAETDKRLHADGKQWGFTNDQAAPKKYNVLLIGDSVTGGYRDLVKAALSEEANCDVWLTPAHLKSKGLCDELKVVVSTEKYDAIHFNIGLHGWPEGRILEGEYEPAMRQYVDVLKKHAGDAQLIWGSTTPIMTKETPRVLDSGLNPIIIKRNAIANRIMFENGILIDDLYDLMSRRTKLGGDPFHWNHAGKSIQTKSVVKSVRQVLASKGLSTMPVETIAYKKVGNNDIFLDVYRSVSKSKTPVFIMVHGGSWVSGTRASAPDVRLGQLLAKEGIAFVGVDYRLMTGKNDMRGSYPRAMEDLADALKWVVTNADAYNFDLDRIGMGGSSAGGHLSSIFAQQNNCIKYYVGLCGQYDLVDSGNSQFPSQGHMKNFGIVSDEEKAAASAIRNIRKNPPSTLLMFGSKDKVIDTNQAYRFKTALEENNGTVKVEVFENQGHSFFRACMDDDRSSIDTMISFLKSTM